MKFPVHTIAYGTALILLGILSTRTEIVVVALLFMIGALVAAHMGYDRNVANVIGLTVCSVFIAARVHTNKNATTTEHFEQSHHVPEIYEENQDLAPSQPCRIYYVPQQYHAACDYPGELFKRTTLQLNVRRNELQAKQNKTPQEIEEQAHIVSVLQARETLNVPGGGTVCKFEEPNYLSHMKMDYTNRRTMASRNNRTPEGRYTEDSSQWAFCWRPHNSRTEAETVSENYSSRGEIVSGREVKSFTDSPSWYSKIVLRRLDYPSMSAAFCTTNTTLPNTYNNYALIGFTVNEAMNVTMINAYQIRNGVIETYAQKASVFQLLFEVQIENTTGNMKKITISPKTNTTVQRVKIMINPCGAIEQVQQSPMMFSLASLFNVQKRDITTIPYGITLNVSNGQSVDIAINQQVVESQTRMNAARIAMNNIGQSSSEDGVPSFENLQNGLSMWRYDISSADLPNAYNADDMERIFTRMLVNGQYLGVTIPYIGSEAPGQDKKAWEFKGYLYIPETGTYRFKINSDDAGELFVGETLPNNTPGRRANQLVSTYYGYHGAGDAGVVVSDFFFNKGVQKIYARFIEWGGWEVIHIKWQPPNSLSREFETIPSEYLAHDDESVGQALQQYAEREIKEREIQDEKNKIDILKQLQQTVRTQQETLVQQMMDECVNKQLGVPISDLSFDDRLYIHAGNPTTMPPLEPYNPSERQVLVDELVNLSANARAINSPYGINMQSDPVYSMAMWIMVPRAQVNWRPVVYFGSEDWYWQTDKYWGRTPGVWIFPDPMDWTNPRQSQGRVYVHVVHRVKSVLNRDWNDNINFNFNLDTPSQSSPYGEWFHFAYSINKDVAKMYLNGELMKTIRIKDRHPDNVFEWQVNSEKKVFNIGKVTNSRWQIPAEYPVYLQKLYWYNSEITPDQVRALSQEEIAISEKAVIGNSFVPTDVATSLQQLFDRTSSSGRRLLRVGQRYVFHVYVDVVKDNAQNVLGKWLLILNYNHKGGTNPPLNVLRETDGFPMHKRRRGDDGSRDPRSWGHLSASFLNTLKTLFSFTKMRFYGETSAHNRVINFETSDPKFINYATTGRGSVIGYSSWNLLPGHTASIPQDSPSGWSDRGDYALTDFPMYRGWQAHWGIRGLHDGRYRWEVDDILYNHDPAYSYSFDTVHQVYIA